MLFKVSITLLALCGGVTSAHAAAPLTPTTSADLGLARGALVLSEQLEKFADPMNWSLGEPSQRSYEVARIATMKQWLGAMEGVLLKLAKNQSLDISHPFRGALEQTVHRLRIIAHGERFNSPTDFAKLIGHLVTDMRTRFNTESVAPKAPGILGRVAKSLGHTPKTDAAHDAALNAMGRVFLDSITALKRAETAEAFMKNAGLAPENMAPLNEFWSGANSMLGELASVIRFSEIGTRSMLTDPANSRTFYADARRVTDALSTPPLQPADGPVLPAALEKLNIIRPVTNCERALTVSEIPKGQSGEFLIIENRSNRNFGNTAKPAAPEADLAIPL